MQHPRRCRLHATREDQQQNIPVIHSDYFHRRPLFVRPQRPRPRLLVTREQKHTNEIQAHLLAAEGIDDLVSGGQAPLEKPLDRAKARIVSPRHAQRVIPRDHLPLNADSVATTTTHATRSCNGTIREAVLTLGLVLVRRLSTDLA